MRKKEKKPTDPRKGRKSIKLYTVLAICLLIAVLINMALIFYFSEESVEESGDRSSGIVEKLVYLFYPNYAGLEWNTRIDIMIAAHKLVRKLAHFSEFGLLGVLFTSLIIYVNRRTKWVKRWLEWVIPIAFCLLYAISDEVHQIFSNRGARVTDVLIDFSGALCGILLIHGLVWLFSRKTKGKKKTKGRESSKRRRKPCETPATD